MKKVTMNITIAPEVYTAMVADITGGKHRNENELIDDAVRKLLSIPSSLESVEGDLEVNESKGCS